ncbi:RdlA protein [Streptomyces sp. ISL-66]|uniref:rodlin n=1 Tax=Streptomyces sp. ISL-66 TaxID=2819186 RepID=UPI001BE8609C|nr:rodlin [Streptomyces sp. ISL-66]MBT2472201.1 RdlA protein [Streptomyces sp. ISL-66]
MLKKIVASTAVATAALGLGAALAPQAMAVGNDEVNMVNGNGASQIYGNMKTTGDMSPQMALVQGSLNKPCIALPAKLNVQNLVGVVNVGLQDVPILSATQNQQCVENSNQVQGDGALSHILDDIPVLSQNGSAN